MCGLTLGFVVCTCKNSTLRCMLDRKDLLTSDYAITVLMPAWLLFESMDPIIIEALSLWHNTLSGLKEKPLEGRWFRQTPADYRFHGYHIQRNNYKRERERDSLTDWILLRKEKRVKKKKRDKNNNNNNKTIFRKVSPHWFSAYSVSYSSVLRCHLPHPPANLFLESQPSPQLRGCIQLFHTFSCQDCFLWQRGQKKSIKRARF